MSKSRFHFSLLTQFTLLSLIVTAAIAIALAYVLRQKVIENMLEQVATIAGEQADRIIAPYLTAADFAGLSPDRLAALDDRIRNEVIGQHIVRVKIWNSEGILIYSDDRQSVMKNFPVSDELEQALAGDLAMDVSALDKPENESESNFAGQRLFEIYVPIRLESSQVLGAYEIYHDLGVLQARIDELSRLVYGSVALGVVILYLSLYLLVRRASRELVRRNAENARLFEQEQTRRQELSALYDLSRTLSDSDDFGPILDVIVRRAVETIQVSFARVALLEGDELVVRAGHPIRVLDHDLQIGRRESLAALPYIRRILARNEPLILSPDSPDLKANERGVLFLDNVRNLCLVPLRASDHDLGLLMLGEMRNAAREPFTPEKIRLARSIGDQAAGSLLRASLHEQTVSDAAALALAYDATIEGWSHALDLRDKETEGHTLRVTEMTERLARSMGITEAELVHFRRGALLHDIGKMAIPDSILLKPGPLTDEEWAIMRKHPTYAYELLWPIAHLRPALDIPYCHHEKWDGTGYPRGLKGEGIPLPARIFAVGDVWDALRSQRPYRRAWPEELVLEHIRSLSGTHFDPLMVELFLRVAQPEREYPPLTCAIPNFEI
jgi:putative nucleotidyltransferase with HDIG domain